MKREHVRTIKGAFGLVIFFTALTAFTSCHVQTDGTRREPYVPYVTDQIVLNDTFVLRDGQGRSRQIDKGKYKIEMTANNDGATIELLGSGCPESAPVKTTSIICEVDTSGQLIITNPTVFALGKDVSVTVKVTKLAQ